MEKSFQAVAVFLMLALALFFAATTGALFGALGGWVLEHTPLADFIVPGLRVFGIEVSANLFPAIGAVFGWLGAFIRTSASHSKE